MRPAIVPLHTKRLIIRALNPEDLNPVFQTLKPETSEGRVFEKRTIEEAEIWLRRRISEQELFGYSIWAVETKNGHFVGLCGLIPWKPFPMICYAIQKRFQGNGFGCEAAKAVLISATETFGSVICTIRGSNNASIRLAQKIGMRNSDEAYSEEPDMNSFIFP